MTQRRDISLLLQALRRFLLGRPYKSYLRFAMDLAPKEPESPPSLPKGVHEKLSRCVPPVVCQPWKREHPLCSSEGLTRTALLIAGKTNSTAATYHKPIVSFLEYNEMIQSTNNLIMVSLYYTKMSHPSRAVLLLARAIGLELELKNVNILAGDHFSEEFLNMNPQHCIPLLADEDFYLSESGAINIYLVEKYGEDDSLYPKDLEKRATINQRILFSSSVLWIRLHQTYIFPVCFQNMGINDLTMDRFDDGFNILNKYLDGNDWVAGGEISVADYTMVPIVSCAEALGYNISKHENVDAWLTRCKETMKDYEELNQEGLDQFAAWFHGKLSKIESLND